MLKKYSLSIWNSNLTQHPIILFANSGHTISQVGLLRTQRGPRSDHYQEGRRLWGSELKWRHTRSKPSQRGTGRSWGGDEETSELTVRALLELLGAGQKWDTDSVGITPQFLDIAIYLTEFQVPIQHHPEQETPVGPYVQHTSLPRAVLLRGPTLALQQSPHEICTFTPTGRPGAG